MKTTLVSLVLLFLGVGITFGDEILPAPKTEAAKPAVEKGTRKAKRTAR